MFRCNKKMKCDKARTQDSMAEKFWKYEGESVVKEIVRM